jgi:hypothetical protein
MGYRSDIPQGTLTEQLGMPEELFLVRLDVFNGFL